MRNSNFFAGRNPLTEALSGPDTPHPVTARARTARQSA